jgi:hypothetical protein
MLRTTHGGGERPQFPTNERVRMILESAGSLDHKTYITLVLLYNPKIFLVVYQP